MNPEGNYGTAPDPSDDQFKKRLRLLVVLVVVMIVVFVVLAIVGHNKAATKFAVTRTTPTVLNVNTQTPSLSIVFNEPLAANSASVGSNPSIITGSSISGSSLKLTFAPKTLATSKTYFITIKSIRSSTGQQLTNTQISFKPSLGMPNFTGEDALTNIGITTTQLNDINTYVAQFNPYAQTATIDPSSIKHYQVNPSDPWTPWAVGFSMNLDGTNYTVQGAFYDTQDIQVKITDPSTGNQVYTAGSPGSF